ncbi:hypothetical protein PSACC_00500 [Paramicrosporidium saccamoebae]|uniref:Yeast cell wall synthesis Kre9/Knh1-like N-terminal domain-containing protein n=1 Tax=Paramicrosporidium saccamoebae TaxID=1246581 RepID=A0A2H9TPL0_9FUNG|nr:hypothetical protein PSACC_00500 [Paramicrosporidium saccamoebae]
MIFSLAASLFLAVVAAGNPKVISPGNMTYSAGDVMNIQWDGSNTGFVNIDLVDMYPDVLQFPLMIASGVPGEAGKYSWKIPSELKTAAGYCLRVWGSQAPQPGASEGLSSTFTILNDVPNAVNTFLVTSPNKDCPCAIGTNCQIKWDFPITSNYPAMVDIAVYRVGNPTPLLEIATVSSTLKGYTWAVPNDPNLMTGDVYISVSGQGLPLAGPSMANDMGGNSMAFAVQPTPPPAPVEKKEDEKKKDEKKKMPKVEPPKPKVQGAAKKEGNGAENVKAAAAMVAAAVLVPLALAL